MPPIDPTERIGPTASVKSVAEALQVVPLRDFTWREENDPYKVLLAEILLQRTTGTHAEKVYWRLLEAYPTLQHLVEADLQELGEILHPLGLHKRTDFIIRAARHLVHRHDGHVPDDYQELLAIPIVGPYTASAVLCFGFGEPMATVDINTARVVSRVFHFRPEKNRIHNDPRVRALAKALIEESPEHARQINFAFLDIGARHCRSTPKCPECPLREVCAVGQGHRDPLRTGD